MVFTKKYNLFLKWFGTVCYIAWEALSWSADPNRLTIHLVVFASIILNVQRLSHISRIYLHLNHSDFPSQSFIIVFLS